MDPTTINTTSYDTTQPIGSQSSWTEMLRRVVKYLVEGFVVALVAYYIPQRTLQLREILYIGLTAAFTFAILDMFAPTIAAGTRFGAGFGVGSNLVGFGNPLGAMAARVV
jgi:hypothetical protein